MTPKVPLLAAIAAFALTAAAPADARTVDARLSMVPSAGPDACWAQPTLQSCRLGKALIGVDAVAISPDGRYVYTGSAGAWDQGPNSVGRTHGGIAIFGRAESGKLQETACVSNDSGRGDDGSAGACADGTGINDVDGLAVSHDGTSLYAVSYHGAALTVFDRDAATGAVTQQDCLRAYGLGACSGIDAPLIGASAVVVSPDDQDVYVASAQVGFEDSNAVTSFARDPASGAVHKIACVSQTGTNGRCELGNGLRGVDSLAISPDGRNVYGASSSSPSLVTFRRDPATGLLKQTGCLRPAAAAGTCTGVARSFVPTSVAVSPDGRNVYVTSGDDGAVVTFARDAADGGLTPRSCNAMPPESFDDSDESAADAQDSSPGLTCSPAKSLSFPDGLAISPDGGTVLVVDRGRWTVTTFARDARTGDLTQVECVETEPDETAGCMPYAGLEGANAAAFSPDGRNAYVTAGDPRWTSDEGERNTVITFATAPAVVSARVAVGRGARARLRISCPAVGTRRCSGTARLARSMRRDGRRVRLSLSAGRAFRLRPGTTAVAELRLKLGARRALRRHRHVAALAVLGMGHRGSVARRVVLRR